MSYANAASANNAHANAVGNTNTYSNSTCDSDSNADSYCDSQGDATTAADSPTAPHSAAATLTEAGFSLRYDANKSLAGGVACGFLRSTPSVFFGIADQIQISF